MWAEQDYLHPRALVGYFPCYSEGNEIVVLDPEDRETVLQRLVGPRQPNGDRICLADFYRPKDSGELDVVVLQAVTVGDEVTELMARLEAGGRVRRAALHARARRPDRRGPGRVAALRGSASDLGIPADAGPPLLVGLPRDPGAVRAPEGRRAARPRTGSACGSPTATRRARAVHARGRRPPPRGDLLRHHERPAAARRPPRPRRRRHQGLAARSLALRRCSTTRRGRARGDRVAATRD